METTDETTECAYCNHDVPYMDESQQVPDVTDDEAWEDLAKYHDPECEWIVTRAHRININ